jgi:hypothetical protein
MVIMEKPAVYLLPEKRSPMNMADFQQNLFMLTLGSFAFACIAIIGCVLWACAKDQT